MIPASSQGFEDEQRGGFDAGGGHRCCPVPAEADKRKPEGASTSPLRHAEQDSAKRWRTRVMGNLPGGRDSTRADGRNSSVEALAELPQVTSSWDGGKQVLATFASGIVLGVLLAIVLGSLLGGGTHAQIAESSPTIEVTPSRTPTAFAEILPVYYFVVGPDTDAAAIAEAVNKSASVKATRYFVVIPEGEAAEEEERRLGETVEQYVEGGWPVQVIDLR